MSRAGYNCRSTVRKKQDGYCRQIEQLVQKPTNARRNDGALWFLMAFIYMQGIAENEAGLQLGIAGLVPIIRVPYLNIVMVGVCLVASIMILVEPILPSGLSSRTRKARKSLLGEYVFYLNVYTAFTVGLLSGIVTSVETLFHYPWLVNAISGLGFIIFLVMTIKFQMSLFDLRRPKE